MRLNEEFQLAKLLGKQHTERWEAVGVELIANHEVIGEMRTPTLARLVAAIHNVFLPLANRLLLLTRHLRDVEDLERNL